MINGVQCEFDVADLHVVALTTTNNLQVYRLKLKRSIKRDGFLVTIGSKEIYNRLEFSIHFDIAVTNEIFHLVNVLAEGNVSFVRR